MLVASFGCYGILPWLHTRPPRSIEPAGPIDQRSLALRRLNMAVLDQAAVQVNTLPSGHTATALAAALVVGELLPGLLPVLVALALAIALATVIGRYHYAVDTILGLAVGIARWWVSGVLVALTVALTRTLSPFDNATTRPAQAGRRGRNRSALRSRASLRGGRRNLSHTLRWRGGKTSRARAGAHAMTEQSHDSRGCDQVRQGLT